MAPTPDKRFVRVHLDELGSFVWLRLDGVMPLGSLAQALGERFPDQPGPQTRLCVFARQLAGTHLVGFTP